MFVRGYKLNGQDYRLTYDYQVPYNNSVMPQYGSSALGQGHALLSQIWLDGSRASNISRVVLDGDIQNVLIVCEWRQVG